MCVCVCVCVCVYLSEDARNEYESVNEYKPFFSFSQVMIASTITIYGVVDVGQWEISFLGPGKKNKNTERNKQLISFICHWLSFLLFFPSVCPIISVCCICSFQTPHVISFNVFLVTFLLTVFRYFPLSTMPGR